MEQLCFEKQLKQSGFRKQKGETLPQVMFATLIWPLLDVRSISNFCGRLLSVFIKGGKNVLYDFLKRDNLPWQTLRIRMAKQAYRKNGLDGSIAKAFVFDDTLKHRRGKKVEGSSIHFDHTVNRHVQAHQVLEMGLVSSKGYLPLDSQIVVGKKKAVFRKKPFQYPESGLQDDYERAVNDSKNKMLREMLERVLKFGFKAAYVIGDAWFGNKGNVKAVLKANMTAIFRMRDSNLKFRLSERRLTVNALYHLAKFYRRPDKHSEKLPWKTWTLSVELNLAENADRKDDCRRVNLVFSVPKHRTKDEFAVFLCTDTMLSAEEILEVYALRWGIELYFKEVKQYMGFMKEQTGNYSCHYASVHLSALRYILFSHIFMQEGTFYIGKHRKNISDALELMSFASLLWTLFKAIVNGALDDLKSLIGCELLQTVKDHIDCTVTEFLNQALQLDPKSLLEESRAEKAGAIF